MLLFGRDVIRRTPCMAQCVSPEAREEKWFSHLREKTKWKCQAFAFQFHSPLHVFQRNMLVTCISHGYHQTILMYAYLKKNPTFKTITDFFRKAKIPATNIFKTHKQANAYPPCTAYPAAQNKGQSWTRFPFPQPPPYSTSNEQGQRPSLQSRFGAGELSPTLQQAPSSWLSRLLLTPAATSQKPLVFQ